MSAIDNITAANNLAARESAEHELPFASPIWSFPELSDNENRIITKARLEGYAGFYPCMNGSRDQAKKTLAGARQYLIGHLDNPAASFAPVGEGLLRREREV